MSGIWSHWFGWIDARLPGSVREDYVSLVRVRTLATTSLLIFALSLPGPFRGVFVLELPIWVVCFHVACLGLTLAALPVLLRAGRLAWPTLLLGAGLYLPLSETAIRAGGFDGATTQMLAVLPLLTGLMLGMRACLQCGALIVVTFAAFYVQPLLFTLTGPEVLPAGRGKMFLYCMLATLGVIGFTSSLLAILEHSIRSLERARDEADAANRHKSDFLANMSHEIRTPMNGVLSLLGLALRKKLPDDIHAMLKDAEDSARILLDIINDVLDLSKLEAGRFRLVPRPFRLCDTLRRVANLLRMKASEKGVEFAVETDPALPVWLLGDETRIQQVLFNLAGNAVKFTDHGHVTVRVICRHATDEAVDLRLEVEDSGPGLTAEERKAIFERFVQTDNPRTRLKGGTGLGLTICAELVRMMDGRIGVDSEPGLGSTFWVEVHLPVAAGQIARETEKTADPEKGRPLRVLAADDNAINRKVMGLLLESFGVEDPVIVGNGQEALAALARESFDCVLLDCQMPVMDGPTAAREARRRFRNPPPLIAVTANAMVGDRESLLTDGFDGYVSKPIVPEDLFTEITRLSEAHTARAVG